MFAKALTEDEFNQASLIERAIDKNKASSSGCFIATATMGDVNHPVILDLTRFRDNFLMKSVVGNRIIKSYYFWSPGIADLIAKNTSLRNISYIFVVKPVHVVVRLLFTDKSIIEGDKKLK